MRNLNEIKNSKFKNFIIKPIDSRGARGVMYLNKTKVNKYWKEIKNNSKKNIFNRKVYQWPSILSRSNSAQ